MGLSHLDQRHSVALKNVCAFYIKSDLSDFKAIAGRPFTLSKSGSCCFTLALYSIVEVNRILRGSIILGVADKRLSLYPRAIRGAEDGWSMLTDMVGRNAEAFNLGVSTIFAATLEDYMPIGWRYSDRLLGVL